MGGNLYEKPAIWTKNEKNITFYIVKLEYRLLVKVKVMVKVKLAFLYEVMFSDKNKKGPTSIYQSAPLSSPHKL